MTCLAEGRPCPHRIPALAGGASVGAITAAAGAMIGFALGHERWESLLPPGAGAVHVRPSLAPVRGGVAAAITIRF